VVLQKAPLTVAPGLTFDARMITRLRESFYGGHNDEELFLARVTKEAVHELGHTYNTVPIGVA
jgi:predicted Zn-dependent protease